MPFDISTIVRTLLHLIQRFGPSILQPTSRVIKENKRKFILGTPCDFIFFENNMIFYSIAHCKFPFWSRLSKALILPTNNYDDTFAETGYTILNTSTYFLFLFRTLLLSSSPEKEVVKSQICFVRSEPEGQSITPWFSYSYETS